MEKIKLGDILDVKRGCSLSGDYYSGSGNFIRLTLGNFNYPDNGFKPNDSKNNLYFIGDVKEEFILKKGDIITPLTEQVRGLLGNTATIPESNKYIQSGDIGRIIPKRKKVDARFVYYLVSSPIVKKQLDAGSQQTKIRHTSPDAIKSCVAYIPTIDMQRKIADFLDVINSKIGLNNKINDNLSQQCEIIFRSIFSHLTSKEKHISDYILPKRGTPLLSKNLIAGDVPVIAAGVDPCGYHSESNTKGPVITISSSGANAGYVNLWCTPVWASDCCFIDSSITKHVYFWYLALKLRQKEIFSMQNGSAQPHIYPSHIENMQIGTIDNDKLNKFDSIVTPMYSKIGQNVNQNRLLQNLRDYLLPLLLNGQVTIR